MFPNKPSVRDPVPLAVWLSIPVCTLDTVTSALACLEDIHFVRDAVLHYNMYFNLNIGF